jgi:hypothetical protein
MNGSIVLAFGNISIPLTAFLFYFFYKQKITRWDVFGSIFIIGADILLVVASYHHVEPLWSKIDENQYQDSHTYFIEGIIMQSLAGIMLALIILNLKFIMKDVGFPLDQIIFDSKLITGLLMVPSFFNELFF